ncbi:MAG: hypothetical protein MI923_07585 [Phycisphaerales bacterium]|nr:hypothetical protein [Phycisphaerales bacterium]
MILFDWTGKLLAGILAALFGCALLTTAGCGINPSLTTEQQQQDTAQKMAWVDKAIEVAEKHNLAYRVEVDSTGRPSIGESVDLYLDTGLSAKVIMFGNGAAGRMPLEFSRDEP